MSTEDSSPEARIYRHEERTPDGELANGDPALIDDVTSHIEAHVGPIVMVFYEIVSTRHHQSFKAERGSEASDLAVLRSTSIT